MMRCCLLLCLLGVVGAQYYRREVDVAATASRPGDCPPALPIDVCFASCRQDTECEGFYKCCRTSCGGTVCSRPVTSRRFAKLKAGNCPAVPTGRWVCSDTCSSDGDCPGRTKCCRNRCGALACSLPDY